MLTIYDPAGAKVGQADKKFTVTGNNASSRLLRGWLRDGVPSLQSELKGDVVADTPSKVSPDDPFFSTALIEHLEREGWGVKDTPGSGNTPLSMVGKALSRLPRDLIAKAAGQPCKPGETASQTDCIPVKGPTPEAKPTPGKPAGPTFWDKHVLDLLKHKFPDDEPYLDAYMEMVAENGGSMNYFAGKESAADDFKEWLNEVKEDENTVETGDVGDEEQDLHDVKDAAFDALVNAYPDEDHNLFNEYLDAEGGALLSMSEAAVKEGFTSWKAASKDEGEEGDHGGALEPLLKAYPEEESLINDFLKDKESQHQAAWGNTDELLADYKKWKETIDEDGEDADKKKGGEDEQYIDEKTALTEALDKKFPGNPGVVAAYLDEKTPSQVSILNNIDISDVYNDFKLWLGEHQKEEDEQTVSNHDAVKHALLGKHSDAENLIDQFLDSVNWDTVGSLTDAYLQGDAYIEGKKEGGKPVFPGSGQTNPTDVIEALLQHAAGGTSAAGSNTVSSYVQHLKEEWGEDHLKNVNNLPALLDDFDEWTADQEGPSEAEGKPCEPGETAEETGCVPLVDEQGGDAGDEGTVAGAAAQQLSDNIVSILYDHGASEEDVAAFLDEKIKAGGKEWWAQYADEGGLNKNDLAQAFADWKAGQGKDKAPQPQGTFKDYAEAYQYLFVLAPDAPTVSALNKFSKEMEDKFGTDIWTKYPDKETLKKEFDEWLANGQSFVPVPAKEEEGGHPSEAEFKDALQEYNTAHSYAYNFDPALVDVYLAKEGTGKGIPAAVDWLNSAKKVAAFFKPEDKQAFYSFLADSGHPAQWEADTEEGYDKGDINQAFNKWKKDNNYVDWEETADVSDWAQGILSSAHPDKEGLISQYLVEHEGILGGLTPGGLKDHFNQWAGSDKASVDPLGLITSQLEEIGTPDAVGKYLQQLAEAGVTDPVGHFGGVSNVKDHFIQWLGAGGLLAEENPLKVPPPAGKEPAVEEPAPPKLSMQNITDLLLAKYDVFGHTLDSFIAENIADLPSLSPQGLLDKFKTFYEGLYGTAPLTIGQTGEKPKGEPTPEVPPPAEDHPPPPKVLPKLNIIDNAHWPPHVTGAQWASNKIAKLEKLVAEGKWDEFQANFYTPSGKPNTYQKAVAQACQLLAAKKNAAAPSPPPAIAPPPADAPPPLSIKGWKKTGGKLGSNEGGQYEDEKGQKWYVKFAQDKDRAVNEILAGKLYELTEMPVVPLEYIDASSEGYPIGVASKWMNVTGPYNPKTPGHMAAAHENFAVHAWLANQDCTGGVGTPNDNLVWTDKGLTAVDVGGSLLFRAMGGAKSHTGEMSGWGSVPTQWFGLQGKGVSNPASETFASMTDQQKIDSATKVTSVSDDAIKEAVHKFAPKGINNGKIHQTAEQIAQTLIDRKDWIGAWAWKAQGNLSVGEAAPTTISPAEIAAYKAGKEATPSPVKKPITIPPTASPKPIAKPTLGVVPVLPAKPVCPPSQKTAQAKFDALETAALTGDVSKVEAVLVNPNAQWGYTKKAHKYKMALIAAMKGGAKPAVAPAAPIKPKPIPAPTNTSTFPGVGPGVGPGTKPAPAVSPATWKPTPLAPATATGKVNPASLPTPPEWKDTHPHKAANDKSAQDMLALAQAGDVDGLGAYPLPTGFATSKLKQFQTELLVSIQNQLNPPPPPKVFEGHLSTLTDAYFNAKHYTGPKMGYYLIVGEPGVPNWDVPVTKKTASYVGGKSALDDTDLQKLHDQAWAKISSTAKSVLKSYTGSGSSHYNEQFWQGEPSADLVKTAQEMMQHAPEMPVGMYWQRNVELSPAVREQLLNSIGKIVQEPAFGGGSIGGAYGSGLNTQFKLKALPGVKHLYSGQWSLHPSEHETFPVPGQRYWIKSVEKVGGKLIIEGFLMPTVAHQCC